MYLVGAKVGPKAPLDAEYAFRKLKRWMAEGPTERNRKMAQFLLSNGRLGPRYGFGKRHGAKLPEDAQLLINLAVEWNDFAMWDEVLKKSGIDMNPKLLGSAPLVRAWSVFPFNVTRPMFVSSEPPPSPVFSLVYSRCSSRMFVADSKSSSFTSLAERPQSSLSTPYGLLLPMINKTQ